jgi:hypothetical protein
MRTTVTLDRDLERILRETAVRTRRPFKKVLNDTLRSALEGQAGMQTAEPFVVEARPMGLRAGLDPAGFNRLADDLEAEAFLETTRKLVDHSR